MLKGQLQAAAKGLSPTESGIIFSIYELVMFVVSPLFGKYVSAAFPYIFLRKRKLFV